jgi:hypothetical protein
MSHFVSQIFDLARFAKIFDFDSLPLSNLQSAFSKSLTFFFSFAEKKSRAKSKILLDNKLGHFVRLFFSAKLQKKSRAKSKILRDFLKSKILKSQIIDKLLINY